MEKAQYKTPEIKVVEFKVERGYALSNGFMKSQSGDAFVMDFDETSNSPRNEQYIFDSETNFWN